MAEKILYPSRWLRLFIPCVGAAGGVVGYQLLSDSVLASADLWDNPHFRHGIGLFLISGSIIIFILGLINFVPQACFLKLDPDRLVAVIFFYRQELRWADVRSFRIFRFHKSARFHVVADVYEDALVARKIGGALRKQYGHDFFMPCNYGVTAQKLADLLNEWRERYGRRER